MTQWQLDREAAQVTGESIETIRRHSFSLVTPLRVFDPLADEQFQEPQMVDWDQIEAERYARAAWPALCARRAGKLLAIPVGCGRFLASALCWRPFVV